jgi:hypothetical protein
MVGSRGGRLRRFVISAILTGGFAGFSQFIATAKALLG